MWLDLYTQNTQCQPGLRVVDCSHLRNKRATHSRGRYSEVGSSGVADNI